MTEKGIIERHIDEYVGGGFDRWHTPGHGGGINSRDVTELGGGKIFPADSILEAEYRVAAAYRAKALRFLVNGSSIGIKAALYAVARFAEASSGKSIEKSIITGSSNHRAVGEGCELFGLGQHIIECPLGADGLPKVLTVDDIACALKKYSQAAAVLITSPDYYGRCVDVRVAAAVKAAGKILIADSAHGAHFEFCCLAQFSFSGLADFCNMSAHKTLAAYTQTAYLAINNLDLLSFADHGLRLLGTTSPNYMFYERLENAAAEAAAYDYRPLRTLCEQFKRKIVCLNNDDYTRIVIDCKPLALSGGELEARLVQNKIMAEMSDGRYTVLIAAPHTRAEAFKRLTAAVGELVKNG